MQSCKNLFPACKLFGAAAGKQPRDGFGKGIKQDIQCQHPAGQTICQATHNRPVVFFPAAEQASWKPRRLLCAGLCNYAENPASYIRGWVFCLEILFTVLSEKGHSDSLFFRGSRRRRTRIRPRCGRRSICYSISSRLDEAGTSFCFGSVTRRTPSAYAALMPAASMPEISKLLA